MQWIKDHKGISIAAGIIAVAGAIFVLVWFQPQALFIDDVVDETIPTASPATEDMSDADTTDDDMSDDDMTDGEHMSDDDMTDDGATVSGPAPGVEPPTFPLTLTEGEFIDLAHTGTGTALIIELEDGSRILRFEDLDIDNGPDLRVILTQSPLVEDDGAYDDGDFVDLGVLKGNVGNQNYEIPDEIDIDEYLTVAIWCRRFNVSFNAAPLTPIATG